MTPSDLTRLEAIRERLAKATRGPWWANIHAQVFPESNPTAKGDALAECLTDENADFIAHAREDIAWLLARLAPAAPSGAAIAEHPVSDADTREERTP